MEGENHDEEFKIIKLIPVGLKEAALDSPSFRTAAWHVHEQIENVERWIELYCKAGNRLSNDIDTMQESINLLLGRSFPSFITENIIDHDYTLTAMKSYSEGIRIYWSNFIKCVKGMEKNVIEQLENLHRKEMRHYKEIKRNFDNAQARYDNLLSRYASQSKSKEASALREDAFQLYESRKLYVKSSFDLCISTIALKNAIDKTIIHAFSDQWLMIGHDINESTNSAYNGVANDLRRIRKWSDIMETSMRVLFRELNVTRKELESLVIQEISPPRDLSEYSSWTISSSNSVPNSPVMQELEHASVIDAQTLDSEKHGWLFLRTWTGKPARQVWVRRWVFVKNGIFGWLVQSPNRDYVEESDKIGVLLCNVKLCTQEDRRFCFEITTKDTTIILQAETQQELANWIKIFDAAKRKALESPSATDTDQAFSIIPPIPEFANTVQTSADTELSHERHDSNPGSYVSPSLDLTRAAPKRQNVPTPALQALITAGQTIAGQHSSAQNFISGADKLFDEIIPSSTSLAPTTLANNPLSTGMTKTAIVAHATTPPSNVPNGLTANTWGSVNWANRQDLSDYSENDLNKKSKEKNVSTVQIPKVIVAAPDDGEKKLIQDDTTSTERHDENMTELYATRTYPPYLPYELKVQDAQLRTLFPDVDINEPVVMVFRAVFSGNASQEFSGRIYVTPSRIYLYANNGGMVLVKHRSLGTVVSVRGQAADNYDDFFAEFQDGTELAGKTFLEPGKLLQYRFQFLVNNFKSANPLPLDVLLRRLLEAKVHLEGSNYEGWDDTPSPLGEYEVSDLADEPVENRVPVALDKGLLGQSQKPLVVQARNKIKLPDKPMTYDLSATMAKLAFSQEFELSAKALFHMLFGDKSTIFQRLNIAGGATGLQQSPWIHLNGRRLERELVFETSTIFVKGISSKRQIHNVQKIEKMDDYLLYVICETRTPWNLPFSDSFLQVSRYVISYVSKSTCRLSVWTNTEWTVYWPAVEALLQRSALGDLENQAKTLGLLIPSYVRKLGSKGRTSKAIQLYGQVGKSTAPVTISPADVQPLNSRQQSFLFKFSQRSFAYVLIVSFLGKFYDWAGQVLIGTTRVGKQVGKIFSAHWVLIFVATISILANVFLGTRSTIAYWTERRANYLMDQIGVKPNGILAKAIYLQDLNGFINNGTEIAVDPEGLCYSKFRSLTESFTPDLQLELSNPIYSSSFTQETARRIWKARQKAGIERHQHVVAIRVISRIEEELIRAEWENWLHGEQITCKQLRANLNHEQSFVTSLAGKEQHDKIKKDKLDKSENLGGDVGEENDQDIEKLIENYCNSCSIEYNAEKSIT
ncbi:hypothetical protein V1514DRAFT_278753 [Lipomyces japonicus]|uniref:uncharacterized protein n=1 Tax=Lipomyces japonicus TaxID=56871 RepID=UPI0034CFE94D